jgi:HK97 family phage prohead protease
MFLKTIQERGKRVKVFYAHDWDKLLGPAPSVLNEDAVGLFAAGRLTLDSFWAGEVAWPLMKDGALTEGSFGYETIKADYADDHVRHLREVKLYEISPVPLGMNPLTQLNAIKSYLSGRNPSQFLDDEWRRLLAPLTKGAIAPHTSPKADEDLAWDGAAAVGAAEGARQLRMMHAWMDDDGDPDSKSSYKLPHHLPDGKVVLRGCQAAAGAMMGARTPIAIPEADMAGVRRHIAGHYHQFDRTAPWEEEAGVEAYLETLEVITHELKVGRVLSAASVEKARSALAAVQAALEALNTLLAAAEPEPDKAHSALKQKMRAAQVALSLVHIH